MKATIDTVSNALVTKLIGNKSFIDALSQKHMENGVLDSVKQSVYEANAMDISRTYATVTAIETKLVDLNTDNKALSDEVDALEQYSRRNSVMPAACFFPNRSVKQRGDILTNKLAANTHVIARKTQIAQCVAINNWGDIWK